MQYWFNTRSDKDNVEIQVKVKNDILSFIVPKSRIRNSSGRIFISVDNGSRYYTFINFRSFTNQIQTYY